MYTRYVIVAIIIAILVLIWNDGGYRGYGDDEYRGYVSCEGYDTDVCCNKRMMEDLVAFDMQKKVDELKETYAEIARYRSPLLKYASIDGDMGVTSGGNDWSDAGIPENYKLTNTIVRWHLGPPKGNLYAPYVPDHDPLVS